jgi:hypothetical protein
LKRIPCELSALTYGCNVGCLPKIAPKQRTTVVTTPYIEGLGF